MNKPWRSLALLVVIVLIGVAAYDAVAHKTFSGSKIMFTAPGGRVELENTGGEPVAAVMTASARFTIASADNAVEIVGDTRQRVGNRNIMKYEGELPAGALDLRITRGSDVTFDLTANNGELRATVIPRESGDALPGILIAIGLILGGLFLLYRWNQALISGILKRRSTLPESGPVLPDNH